MRLLTEYLRIIGLALATVAAILLIGCANEEVAVEVEPEVMSVQALTVQRSNEKIVKTFTGSLEGERQATIRARLSEAVDEVKVRPGEAVEEDEIILTLDRHGVSSQYVPARSVFLNAEKTFNIMKYLYEEGAVSESEYDAARTAYEVQKAVYDGAVRSVEIHTPIAGVVTSVFVSPGDLVQVGQELATVATSGRLRVKFGVNARNVGSFRVGDEVEIVADAIADAAPGKVVAVASSADPVRRTFQVEVQMDNSERQFNPGMFVRIDYVQERLENVIAVPHEAVLVLNNQPTVFVVSNGLAKRQAVTVGPDLGGRLIIAAGLSVGDTLVTLGQNYLYDHAPVTVTLEQEQ